MPEVNQDKLLRVQDFLNPVGRICLDYASVEHTLISAYSSKLRLKESYARAVGSGCTCPANAVVRALLRHLIVERDEVVLLDMEAGVEHLGRGTAKHVDIMLIIADSSLKSLETAKHIHKLASDAGIRQVLLVGNRVADGAQKSAIEQYAQDNGLAVLGHVPFDEEVMEADMVGVTPLERQGSVAVQTIEKLGARLLQSER